MQQNIVWMFDVDGVLCNTGEQANDEFKQWFINWAKDKVVYLVTGSQREKTIYQLGQEMVDTAEITFNCLGNSIWIDGEETLINQIILREDELMWFNNTVQDSLSPIKTGWHIDIRHGSINFSTLGRNATPEQREIYKKWDSVVHERKEIILQFTKKFPRFDAYIGGDTSIDICLTGANKKQCADLLPSKSMNLSIYFFGDRCQPGGIDEPLAKHITMRGKVFQVNGYEETWSILRQFK